MLRSRICGARTSAAKLLANRSGNFGLMAAVITPILIGSMGIAIDFAQGVQIRSELTNAADAAMFAGLRAGANAKQSGNVQWKNVAQAEATKNFRSRLSRTNLVDAQLNTDFVERGTSLSGTGSYSYKQNTLFMGLLGSKAVQISNSQSVAISLDTFIDVTFIIDNSASMGIGATLDDRKIMNNANGNCAFACHQGSSTASLPFTPNYVHSIGAKLRIDVVREAMQDAVNKLTARAANPNQVRFSAYTFSHVHETLLAPETDKTKVLAAIAKLDLAKGNVSALNYGDTRITPALKNVAEIIKGRGGSGTGVTAANRKNFVVFFSDGVEDSTAFQTRTGYNIALSAYWQSILGVTTVPNFSWWDTSKGPDWVDHPKVKFDGVGYMQPFPQDGCNALKQTDATVLTAQIKYETEGIVQRPVDVAKISIIKDNAPEILDAFSKCASDPTMTFQAVTSSDITNMFDKVVDEIVPAAPLRLTN